MIKRYFIFPLVVMGCQTTLEQQRSADYAPVFPVAVEQAAHHFPSGSIYASGAKGLFAHDRRAKQVGDILTIELDERFTATKNQATTGAKSSEMDLTLPTKFGKDFVNEFLDGGTTKSFAGSGNASQSNSLKGRMSVSVMRILPGGNLEIMGQKKLTLNNGDEYIRLRGIVRPADIAANNIVQSDRIANAEIHYIGAGQIADTSKPGWLSQITTAVTPY